MTYSLNNDILDEVVSDRANVVIESYNRTCLTFKYLIVTCYR